MLSTDALLSICIAFGWAIGVGTAVVWCLAFADSRRIRHCKLCGAKLTYRVWGDPDVWVKCRDLCQFTKDTGP